MTKTFKKISFFHFSRPDASFLWFLNPLKSIKYVLWHTFKWTILKILIFVLLVLFIAFFIYALPQYAAMRVVGA